jgi:starvation-inducible DNA-binding protein
MFLTSILDSKAFLQLNKKRINMLAENLKVLLASTNVLAIKAQNFHWNVEGDNFPQYHEFFGNFYEEVYGSIDKTAEYIRTLDSYTPGSLTRYAELSIIQDQTKIPRAQLMFVELLDDNRKMIEFLNMCFASASEENKQGIANFIAERLDAHEKHQWMIRSILKTERA